MADNSTGPQQFFHFNPQNGYKQKTIKVTFPQSPVFSNPGQTMSQLSQDPHVRKQFQTMMGKFNSLSQPDLWEKAKHITENLSTGSPVTQIIQHEDDNGVSEAQKNLNVVQMLHRLRTELNTQDFSQFAQKANTGILQTFQSLLSGGGISGIPGMNSNLLSAFTGMGSQATSTGVAQNAAIANNNSFLDANGNIILTTSTV